MQLPKTHCEPVFSLLWLFVCCLLVDIHPVDVGDPDIIPWSPMEPNRKREKWSEHCVYSLSLTGLLRDQAQWPSFQSQGRLRSVLPSITKSLAHKQAGGSPLS